MNEIKKYLNQITAPKDLKTLTIPELVSLAADIRECLIETLSVTGGHFASNLGVVELTIALHYVFNTPEDKIIWDVGHQTYPHKILTGRKEKLKTIRKTDGISGFPKREESIYDHYNTGHAGTSISQALGEAISRDLIGKKNKVVAVIGDASIATGMALEAMNHSGHMATDMLVILNDNDMSISKNVGSISTYLNNVISSHFYNQWRKYSYNFIKWLPLIGPAAERFFKKMEKSFKYAITPGGFFEDLGFIYFGPVSGHDLNQLIILIEKIKTIEGPKILHVITQKGKGYYPAEMDPTAYHGVSSFDKINGITAAVKKSISYSELVGKTLIELSEKNDKIVVVTPAMIEGSGLTEFQERFPGRLFDTGIAEQHAMTFCGAMTDNGIIPFLCIYSTFLSRALDQLIEDVSLMNFPVRIVIDRAGCVGPDGETHQGLFDIGLLLMCPGVAIIAPSNASQLVGSLKYMASHNSSPIAVRFPKHTVNLNELIQSDLLPIDYAKSQVLSSGNLLIISLGAMLGIAREVKEKLSTNGIEAGIIDLVWIRPLDIEALEKEIQKAEFFIIMEESYINAGASFFILKSLNQTYFPKYLRTYAFPEEPIIHGEKKDIFKKYHLDADSIISSLLKNDLLKSAATSTEN